MLRSNLSARADAEAWAATFRSLHFAIHALASNALNLILPHIHTSPFLESPWLPNGKFFGAGENRTDRGPVAARFALATG